MNLFNQLADIIKPEDGTKIDKHGLASELAMMDLESSWHDEDIYATSNGSMTLSETGQSLFNESYRKYVKLIDAFTMR